MKVSYPIYWETEIEWLIDKLKELGRVASEVKRFYPTAWKAIDTQYSLTWQSDKTISIALLDKKLEIALLEDEERRTFNK